MNVKVIKCEEVDSINVAQYRDNGRVLRTR